ncbi:sugar phosphate isomerase/epimerase family protein [Kineococcus rhizosphaerae]|uniref:Sugar phosphate isomerase/epimerase n=1 Tax=Kineococcus rhizosphaerae TaxID=559628 RepID=A0A2T0R4H2_9ACTN|nr:TIM barrel protein [Kineococcus rhizosphaerae]PRY15229.1 sugar phosphate isomerase/epimerase [Kineococcus rhizosphaerae]
MLTPGLCSITFRQLDVDGVLDVAARAGLAAVEWGADVHVPVGDLDTARSVAARTAAAGLRVASYGSYFRAGVSEGFADVLATAVALGAPRVRVWAGAQGSAGAERGPVVAALADAVRRAADAGVQIGTESHGGTLTDTTASTLALLADVDGRTGTEALTTYWQPTVDAPDDDAVAELAVLLPRTSTVHAFSWSPGTTRQPLASRESLWRRAVGLLASSGGDHDVLLEFVPGDDPGVLGREGAVLREWLNT